MVRRGVVSSPEAPPCTIFTVDNASSHSLGTVTVSGLGGSTNFYVTTSGFYQQEICYNASSVNVAGTLVSYPNTAVVDLGGGTLVRVIWQSSSLVEIANEEIEGLSLQ